MFGRLDEDVLIIDILNHDIVALLLVDPHDDGFDGGIALHQDAWLVSQDQELRALMDRRSHLR